MTGKQRAYLRKMAHDLQPIFQVGKAGVTPEMRDTVSQALEKRELIKLTILKNCPYEVKEIAQVLADRTQADVIQVIGRRFVLYRESTDNPEIKLPKI